MGERRRDYDYHFSSKPNNHAHDTRSPQKKEEEERKMMLKPMIISVLAVDSQTKSPIVILKEADGERSLPIWIGMLEAHAIASEMEGIKLLRPMTHDLLKNILELVDVKVNKVEINDLRDNTYYAVIHITHEGKEIAIDARPSDALALSLRTNAPIFASEEIIDQSARIEITEESADKSEQQKKWQKILEKLDPEDLGKA
jgi:bifunctional DNase/RNase